MSITARYVLMADDIRREDSGKIIIIGMYTPDMVVQQIPFLMPTLTFFLSLESDRAGNFGFRTKIEHQDTGTVVQQTQAMGMIAIVNPQQPAVAAVKFAGVIFNSQGLYSFSMDIDDQREPIVSPFNVQLVVAQAGQLPMLGGMR